jgi:hypothetical protein
MEEPHKIETAVHLAALLLQQTRALPAMLRSGAEKGVVDALKQWCAESGCSEQTTLGLLRSRLKWNVAGL